MNGWQRRKLTDGTGDGTFHAHSSYDIPVFDGVSRRLALYRMAMAGAHPGPGDAVEVGWVDLEDPAAAWHAAGVSRAWSVQQGPMAQWIPGGSEIVWNDREGGRFVARIRDIRTDALRTLPRPVYAVSPDGRQGLSLNMARLDRLRPGYGYPGGADCLLHDRPPARPATGARRRLADGSGDGRGPADPAAGARGRVPVAAAPLARGPVAPAPPPSPLVQPRQDLSRRDPLHGEAALPDHGRRLEREHGDSASPAAWTAAIWPF